MRDKNEYPPLTKNQLETLMECHERELLKQPPCEVGTTHYSKGLITRGLLRPYPFIDEKGKKIIALYLTNLGRDYLEKI